MAYFNHAFNKVFVGTSEFVTTAILTQNLTAGQVGLMNPNPGNLISNANLTLTLAEITAARCPLVLVAGSIYQNDKIGPFHGGYQETTKSKIINPKYISRFYTVVPCDLQQATITVGVTDDPDSDPETTASCAKDFICGNNYYLRVDLKGSPALRFLSRNSYFTAMAYTGCCPTLAEGETPPAVDPTTVYIAWANQLMQSPLIAPFIQIAIFDTTGTPGAVVDGVAYNQETYNAAIAAGTPAWSTYTSPAGPYEGLTAGMMITGAYVDTQFGNCTFYPNDALQSYLEPVKIYASEVDYNGDPCAFTGLCVLNSCLPVQGSGYGESIVRELILSEAYNQSPFYTGRDLRIREITQGYDVTNAITRIAPGDKYYRYFIQHSVPRFNNPTGTFDNDQYLLEIVTSIAIPPATIAAIESWIDNAQGAGSPGCVSLETIGCPATCSVVVPPVVAAP
jgi:hypothetical protein